MVALLVRVEQMRSLPSVEAVRMSRGRAGGQETVVREAGCGNLLQMAFLSAQSDPSLWGGGVVFMDGVVDIPYISDPLL